MVELLLRSAIANASHNDKQDPQMMVIKSIVVNQGQAYRRGMPMARGRTRPFRKFLSHIDLELGFPNEEKAKKGTKGTKATKVASTKKSSSSTK
jgi:large subunit ribosomal protein L22